MIDIRELLTKGQEILDNQHRQKELGLLGKFRVGTSGCVTESGDIIGTCHRVGVARLQGIDRPIEPSQKILFLFGEANEDVWDKRLRPAYSGKLLRHSQCPVHHLLPDVDPELLGHPDIVLADENGTPSQGIELKGIFGYTMAVSVFYEDKPKPENLIQAGLYAHCLNIEYALCYTLPCWVSLKPYDIKKYGAKHIRPFDRIYYVMWEGDKLKFRNELSDRWVTTNITVSGIYDYYRLLQEMKHKKTLGPRFTGKDFHGNEPKWSPCGLCAFRHACDTYDEDGDYENWINSIRLL